MPLSTSFPMFNPMSYLGQKWLLKTILLSQYLLILPKKVLSACNWFLLPFRSVIKSFHAKNVTKMDLEGRQSIAPMKGAYLSQYCLYEKVAVYATLLRHSTNRFCNKKGGGFSVQPHPVSGARFDCNN